MAPVSADLFDFYLKILAGINVTWISINFSFFINDDMATAEAMVFETEQTPVKWHKVKMGMPTVLKLQDLDI